MATMKMVAMIKSLLAFPIDYVLDKIKQEGFQDIHRDPGEQINDRAKDERSILE